jgi:hypothetical protein
MAKISKSQQQADAALAQMRESGAAINMSSDPMGRASFWLIDANGKVVEQIPSRVMDCIWSMRPIPVVKDESRRNVWVAKK